jgi:hypothetical protein
MKDLIAILIVFFIGCTPSIQYFHKNYDVDKEMIATVGSPMIVIEEGTRAGNSKIGIQKELIYGGKLENTLNITYREYHVGDTGTIIKPGFTLPLYYDIKEDNEIIFRDLQFNILSADNKRIRFIVTELSRELKEKLGIQNESLNKGDTNLKKQCPNCHNYINISAKECIFCKHKFNSGTE